MALVSGAATAPLTAAQNLLAGELAPRGRVTESFTWPVTALVVGIAAGNAAAGALTDVTSWRVAVLAAAALAGAAALLTVARRRTLRWRALSSGAGAEAAAALGPAGQVVDVAERVADAVRAAVAHEQHRVAVQIGAAMRADAQRRGRTRPRRGPRLPARARHDPRHDVLQAAEHRAARGLGLDARKPSSSSTGDAAPAAGLAHAAEDTWRDGV